MEVVNQLQTDGYYKVALITENELGTDLGSLSRAGFEACAQRRLVQIAADEDHAAQARLVGAPGPLQVAL